MIPEKVNLHYQLDWLWNHLGNTPLRVSMRVFSERFDGGGGTHANVGGTIPWAGVFNRMKKRKQTEPQHSSVC